MPAQFAVQTTTIVAVGRIEHGVKQMIVEPNYADFQEYLDGQLAYLHRQPLDDLTNDNARRGWLDAMRYDSDADTETYLATHPPIEVEW